MTEERNLQSDEPLQHNGHDEHKQRTSEHTDPTSSSSSSSSSTTSSTTSASSSSSASTAADSSSAAIEEMLEKDVTKAEAAKAEGNTHFANKQYDAAIESYTHAILLCPTPPIDTATTPTTTTPTATAAATTATATTTATTTATVDQSALNSLLATLHSNRAAAHLNLAHYQQTITDATAAISRQPTVKALLRRSIAYEREEKYAEAIEDVKAAIAMGGLDGKGSGVREEEERLRRLEAARRAKEEAMKAEMLGKLKELGNGLLGKFGMSLDNFKAVKDPNTGSYSLSFGK